MNQSLDTYLGPLEPLFVARIDFYRLLIDPQLINTTFQKFRIRKNYLTTTIYTQDRSSPIKDQFSTLKPQKP